ncbi:MAG: hypothetical protein WDN66_04215 [Candidatus Saccharibacteria bacterium]
MAFEQALKLEDNLAARHVAYAKVQEKLGNLKLMFSELNKALDIEPNKETYTLLYNAYLNHDMIAEANALKKRLRRLTLPSARVKRMIRPKRVIV